MAAPAHCFVTGFPGFIGKRLVRAMLERYPDDKVSLLVHPDQLGAARALVDAWPADLRARLARYHDDPDSAFFGWNDIWLDRAFRAWNIEREMKRIGCPVLAIQGEDDEYGTMLQVDRLGKLVPQAWVVKLAQCGHSPHRDQPDRVVEAAVSFVRTVGR